MSKIRDFITISRIKILIATPAQPLLGTFLAASSIFDLVNIYLIYFLILYIISILYAVNVNCYYDRDIDIKYKVKLARAVDNLGKENIRVILIIETCLIMILSGYLMLVGYVIVGIFSVIGWVISTSYSAAPIRVKKRGYLSALPIIIGLFMFPYINGWLMIKLNFQVYGIIYLIGYILLNEGMNLINTAEDFDEDLSENVKTWAHVFGLKWTFKIALIFTVIGGVCCIWGLLIKLLSSQIYLYNVSFSSAFIIMSSIFILKSSWDLYSIGKRDDLRKAAKENAYRMPFWFASTRYPMLLAALFILLPF
ncbi:MAG: UbiA family prenyltransferase [Candidatus Helarchaeota archaeon]